MEERIIAISPKVNDCADDARFLETVLNDAV